MAEYLIQSETLDDIADAINAKTGGSSAMTPAQMVTAIGAIPGGGGGDGWELVAEATASEDVSVLRADIPAAKQNMAAYLVEYDCTVLRGTASTNNLYGCPRLNSIEIGQPYAVYASVNQYQLGVGRGLDGTYRMILRNSFTYPQSSNVQSVEYVAFVGYYDGNLVAAGSNIKVYGIGAPT